MSETFWVWRIRSSTLAIIVGCCAITFLLVTAIVFTGDEHMKVIDNVVNLGGAALTFVGLSYAYIRSEVRLRAWFERAWARFTGNPIPTRRGAANGTYGWVTTTAAGKIGFTFSDSEDRADQLLRFVNQLSANLAATDDKICDLSKAIDQAVAAAREGDQRLRADTETALREFANQLKQSEVLDLRWAIAGVFFSMLGAAISFCT
ncbi:hypothetical protein OG976_24090 [Mycobacterium sp. NBC_00419]|uniref:hypothetical protein n=1 Tax=Mycobacterium sp. NBC_00419 TaxID=2975989 RepID=UPI002E24D526